MMKWEVDKRRDNWEDLYKSETDVGYFRECLLKKDKEDPREVPWMNWLILRLDLQENGPKYG